MSRRQQPHCILVVLASALCIAASSAVHAEWIGEGDVYGVVEEVKSIKDDQAYFTLRIDCQTNELGGAHLGDGNLFAYRGEATDEVRVGALLKLRVDGGIGGGIYVVSLEPLDAIVAPEFLDSLRVDREGLLTGRHVFWVDLPGDDASEPAARREMRTETITFAASEFSVESLAGKPLTVHDLSERINKEFSVLLLGEREALHLSARSLLKDDVLVIRQKCPKRSLSP